jgi:hypothetical protein
MVLEQWIFPVVFVYLCRAAGAADDFSGCDLYLAPSKIVGVGRGIIAGRNFSKGSAIEVAPAITIAFSLIEKWQLNNYIYDANEAGSTMALIGAGMIYNHRVPKTVTHVWISHKITNIDEQLWAHSTYTMLEFQTTCDVKAGEEMFASYGGANWFTVRGVVPTEGSYEPKDVNNSSCDDT